MRTKEELFDYIGEEDSIYGYSRSYKLVLYKILFGDLWENKKSYVFDVAKKFKDFYLKRISEGKIPDKNVDERIEKIQFSSLNDVLDVIKINPYRHINANGFLEIFTDEKGEYFSFPQEIVSSLTKVDIFSVITLVYKKINLYFSKIDNYEKKVKKAFSLPELGENEAKYAEIINVILEKFSRLNHDSIIEKILDSKEEYEAICDTIRAILKWRRLSYITTLHKELVALFLVSTAKFYYNDREGGFWNQVEKIIPQINSNNHSDIVAAFDDVIKKYNLPDFDDERIEGYKLIAPIICHAGIPINCLDSWFDVIYQLRGVRYAYIENELDFICRYADKPVKRYVKFLSGRGILADEVEQTQELISCVIANKEIPELLDFSFETKMSAIEWAQKRGKDKDYFSERYTPPEFTFDFENFRLNIRLPQMKLKEELWVLWEITAGDKLYKKKVYGKKTESGYCYSDCEILIEPFKTITAQLMSDNGSKLDSFNLKNAKDCLVFNNNGRQNKSRFLSKTASYFICDNDAVVCENLQVVFEYDCFTVYKNDPETSKEIRIQNGDDTITYHIKESPELKGGGLLFDGNADFKNVDAFYELPQLAVPFEGNWEITIIKGNDRRICEIYAEETIALDVLIRKEFGDMAYDIYKLRVKHVKTGYSSFKFAYMPKCTLERTGYFPGNDGYGISKLHFSYNKEISILNLYNEEVSKIEIPVTENIFEGNLCYKELCIPFHVHLKAFTWEIFNEEKSFGMDNRKSNISSTDIKVSEWVMINVHNHTDKTYFIEINFGENHVKTYHLWAKRKFSFNLKELTESIDASQETFSVVSIKVSDDRKFQICSIKKQIHIRGLSGNPTDDNRLLFHWEEDGSLTNREFIVSNAILPYKKESFPIEDGVRQIVLEKSIFAKNQGYLGFVQQREAEVTSIYGNVESKKEITNVYKIYVNIKPLLSLDKNDFKSIIEQENPTLDQIIYSYLFTLLNPYRTEYKQVNKEIRKVYREKIIEHRARFGEAKFYEKLFEYELDEKVWDAILTNLALIMPCFVETQNLMCQDEEALKEKNLIAYMQYLYATKQDVKIVEIKQFIETLKDAEPFVLAKADLIFSGYSNDKEVLSSVREWKKAYVKDKWLTETEALVYTLIDIILDDMNKRLNRVNKDYLNAIYYLYDKYKKTFLQMFIDSIEQNRR